MTRLEAFHSFKDNVVAGKQLSQLSEKELAMCEEFIKQNDTLDLNKFAEKLNMWHVDNKDRPKRHAVMWGLVLMANTKANWNGGSNGR